MHKLVLVFVFGMVATALWAAEPEKPPVVAAEPMRETEPAKPKPVPTPEKAKIEAAIARGVKFLLDDQRADGSWGSAERTKDLNIYAPIPGAHQAFRAAVTSLAISALSECGGNDPAVAKAIDRGEEWLVQNLPQVRRATPDTLYNIWAHGYAISALAHLVPRHSGDAARQEKLRGLMREQMGFLERYESVDGGWGYYDFSPTPTQKPSSSSTSFMSAAVLVALHEAKLVGVEPPPKLVERAIASIHRQQKKDFSYVYGEYLKYAPLHPVNCPGGSLGRTQACNLALLLWGDKKITADVMEQCLDRLFARNLWLDMGRKRPIPHESWFAVAGYFYYFGHYYAAFEIEQLPAERRGPQQDQLATLILKLQEPDGSWWDFPLYNYHQPYGTSFAVMTLVRCVRK